MASAIISDTLLFRSPTCTPQDKYICKKLAEIAGINIEEFAKEEDLELRMTTYCFPPVRREECQGFERLALLEECKSLPWNAVWDMFCLKHGVPVGESFIAEVQKYEAEVTSKR